MFKCTDTHYCLASSVPFTNIHTYLLTYYITISSSQLTRNWEIHIVLGFPVIILCALYDNQMSRKVDTPCKCTGCYQHLKHTKTSPMSAHTSHNTGIATMHVFQEATCTISEHGQYMVTSLPQPMLQPIPAICYSDSICVCGNRL